MADDVPHHLPEAALPLPLWLADPLLDKDGSPIPCMHDDCYRYAVRIVGWWSPRHKQFLGQTHNCCSVHSRPFRTDSSTEGET